MRYLLRVNASMFTQFLARSCSKIDFLCPAVTNEADAIGSEKRQRQEDAQDEAAQADNGKH